MQLSAGPAEVVIDLTNGGRLASLRLDGLPLVFTGGSSPLQWGSYPMVPWAGRVADGRFAFRGQDHQLALNMAPHAIHGVGFTNTWRQLDAETIGLDLTPLWPFGGWVEQRFDLDSTSLRLTMTVRADRDMPVILGWHPWFNRFLGRDGSPIEVELSFEASSMYELDDRAIPTGRLIPPCPGPWDHCFTGVTQEPRLRWPGLVELQLQSSCQHWVVFDQPRHALCVEPQTAAPDEFNREPTVVAAGQQLDAWFLLTWG